jgi:tetratricopeptide (TPR) repeat protein
MVSTTQSKGFLSLWAAVIAAFAALSAAPARAATDAEKAEALIREGVKLRGSDNTARALPLFEQAYQVSRTPRTAAQLGLCELELGYFVEAERYLGEALAAPDHPWVAKNKGALKKSLETARASIGELVLVLSPANVEVILNHKAVDKALLAAPIRVGKGPVDLELRAPGYELLRDTVVIVGGKRESRTYTLVREPPRPAEIQTGALVSQAAPGSDAGVAAMLSTAPPQPGAYGKKRIAAWVTGGAALGALLFGTLEAVSAAGARDAFNNHTTDAGGVAYHDCGTASLSPACKTLKDDYDQALTLTIVGFVAAGALAATSSALFVLSAPGRGERDGGAGALACVPDPIARGLGCSLRF